MQVVATCRAAQLGNLAPEQHPLAVGTLCPVCGGHPVASVIRLGGQAQGYRYLHCGLCACEWHMVRVKCSCCEKNGRIAYQSLQISLQTNDQTSEPQQIYARAETCGDCGCYRKLFNQERDYDAEPLADDLASLALDVLVGEAGYERASLNPLLWLGSS
jgi:FdhE protein